MKKSNPTNVPAITRTYMQLGDESLVAELDKYFEGLSDNPRFPTLADQVTDYGKTISNYQDLQAKAASTGDKNAILARNEARIEVLEATIDMGIAVERVAKGDLAAITSTNLPVRKPAQPIVPEGPVNIRLTDSKISGQLDVKLKRPKGNFIVVARYTMAPLSEKSEWETLNFTKANFSIPGLETANKYFLQFGITGKGDVTLWGDILQSPLIS